MSMPRSLRLALAPILACTALSVIGCAGPSADLPAAPKALARPVVGGGLSASSDAAAPLPAGCRSEVEWSCAQQQRFAAAGAYISRNVSGQGYLSVVFTDRQTGHAWRFGPTRREGWTAYLGAE
jgi:hypothetical protein